MFDFLKSHAESGPSINPLEVLLTLVCAMALGTVVAWIYRLTRKSSEISTSFPVTLVLLSILIAMVTQVIGDNVARAFSLVGALAIVRFRTVVRDTQDTAYVIFAVVVGMAVGARDLWVALIGIVVVGVAAYLMTTRARTLSVSQPEYLLTVRLAPGLELDKLLGTTLAQHVVERELMSVATKKDGGAVEATFETRLRQDTSPDKLVAALSGIEGVQRVEISRRDFNTT